MRDNGRKSGRRVYPRVCGGTHCGCFPEGSHRGLSPRVRGNPCLSGSSLRSERSIPACAGEPLPVSKSRLLTSVYPRVCGGTRQTFDTVLAGQGLSPRVRGNPSLSFRSADRSRSIPACAGEPAVFSASSWSSRVYPRVCGGTISRCSNSSCTGGLSPRVRGNLS